MKHDFIKNVEKMVDPIEVGTIHFMQSFVKSIPPALQEKMLISGASKNPYMGFVVEPYSYFLCYELNDLSLAQQLIPDDYQLIQCKIFKDDTPKYYCIQGCFNVHTSAFWGSRLETYIIAESKTTGLLSWIILDYDTNTVSYDTKRGLTQGNTSTCVVTTSYDGQVIIDVQNKDKNRSLILNSDIKVGSNKELDQRLWLEGNLSITYSKELTTPNTKAFSVIFNPDEVNHALDIPKQSTFLEENTWFPNLFKSEPEHLVCFPYAQHFLSDSPGHYSHLQNEEDLRNKLKGIDFTQFPKYSSASIKKSFQIGQLVSFILIIVLFILLIIK